MLRISNETQTIRYSVFNFNQFYFILHSIYHLLLNIYRKKLNVHWNFVKWRCLMEFNKWITYSPKSGYLANLENAAKMENNQVEWFVLGTFIVNISWHAFGTHFSTQGHTQFPIKESAQISHFSMYYYYYRLQCDIIELFIYFTLFFVKISFFFAEKHSVNTISFAISFYVIVN